MIFNLKYVNIYFYRKRVVDWLVFFISELSCLFQFRMSRVFMWGNWNKPLIYLVSKGFEFRHSQNFEFFNVDYNFFLVFMKPSSCLILSPLPFQNYFRPSAGQLYIFKAFAHERRERGGEGRKESFVSPRPFT